MLKRILTGAVYIAVIVAFFFLRTLDVRLFGILVYAFSIIGTFEMVRALSHSHTTGDTVTPAPLPMSRSQQFVVYAYAFLFTPLFYIADTGHFGAGFRALSSLSFLFALSAAASGP